MCPLSICFVCKHLTPSIVAPRGKVTVDIRKSTAQQLGVYGSRFPMASTVRESSVIVIHSNLSQDAKCAYWFSAIAVRKNLHFEIRNWFSGHQVTSSSALQLPALTVFQNKQSDEIYSFRIVASPSERVLFLWKMTARVGLRVVTTGLRASQATCNFSLPRICALNMKPLVPTFGFNLGLSFVSKKLIQTIPCPHSLEIFCLHPLFRFERNLFISNFKRQQFLHSHLWGWGVRGKAHCPGESDE